MLVYYIRPDLCQQECRRPSIVQGNPLLHMSFRPPVEEYVFLQRIVAGDPGRPGTGVPAGPNDDEDTEILAAVARLASEVLHPLQRSGDRCPARLENGVVVTSKGFSDGFRAIAEGGWIGISASPEFGGAGLSVSMANAVNEILNGACMSLGLCSLLSQSQIRALETHASDALKRIYLPKLVSGEWFGTMNITEPGAGSDVGMLRSTAEPEGDGTFRLSGQKIFISWADADFAGNVCHLALARLPDAPVGTRGLSLFLVPKYIPDEGGNPGRRNSVKIVSLEHKLGLHGSPTAVVEHDRARCWMVGEAGAGMHAMFTMMNMARLAVGAQGVGVAEAAMQAAARFAMDRKQGRPERTGGSGTIVDHSNVRRVLALMKSQIHAARAICAACAHSIDMADITGETYWKQRAAFMTPVAKAYGSDTGVEVALKGISIHGGAGYMEESGVSQFLRDGLVTTIYEGTNGIQAIDLVTRKLGDGCGVAIRMLDEIDEELISLEPEAGDLVVPARKASSGVRAATEWMARQKEAGSRIAGAEPYLRAISLLLGAVFHIRSAAAAGYSGRRAGLARVFVGRHLPACDWHCREAGLGPAGLFELSDHDLAN